MKNKKLIYGTNPQALRKKPEIPSPLTLRELAVLGIPARKAERVQQELAHLAQADSKLAQRPLVYRLARKLAAELF